MKSKLTLPLAMISLLLSVASMSTVAQSPSSQERAVGFVRTRWEHGMPYSRAQDLGRSALPSLYRLLRDPREGGAWSNVVSAIAFIGDTTSFDTLRSFLWNRFTGEVDLTTFKALMAAQDVLGTIAGNSPRALQYLRETADPAAWDKSRWWYSQYSGRTLGMLMSEFTIESISFAETAEAETILRDIQKQPNHAFHRGAIETARGRHALIMRLGHRAYMDSIQARPGGE